MQSSGIPLTTLPEFRPGCLRENSPSDSSTEIVTFPSSHANEENISLFCDSRTEGEHVLDTAECNQFIVSSSSKGWIILQTSILHKKCSDQRRHLALRLKSHRPVLDRHSVQTLFPITLNVRILKTAHVAFKPYSFRCSEADPDYVGALVTYLCYYVCMWPRDIVLTLYFRGEMAADTCLRDVVSLLKTMVRR